MTKSDGTGVPLWPLVFLMGELTWRDRLKAAVDKDPRSMREISLAAGLAHNYVWRIFNDRKMVPTIDCFIAITEVLGINAGEIIEGYTLDEESRAFFQFWAELSPAERQHLGEFLRASAKSRSEGS